MENKIKILSFWRQNPHLKTRVDSAPEELREKHFRPGVSTFWVRGPIYIFHIILRAAVIADYRIIMNILNIFIGAWAARQVTQVKCLWHGRMARWRRWSAYDMGGSPGDVGEVPMAWEKQRKGCRMSCDEGTAAEPHSPNLISLHLRHSSFSNPSAALPTSQLILQSFRCFTYVIGTSPTPKLILQPFRRFVYATAHSTTLPPLHLRHRHFMYFTWRAAHA